MALLLSACGEDMATGGGTPTLIAASSSEPLPVPSPTPTPTPTPTETPTTSATVIAALDASLDDERKAEATYLAIIEKFGAIEPFVSILSAEQRHIVAVTNLYEQRGLDVPDNSWVGRGEADESVAEACETGVAGEIENIAMYDRLLATLTPDEADIEAVFLNLQAASRDHHLPAFQACAEQS